MTPDNPKYSIAESNPTPEVMPDHEFVAPEQGASLPCWKEVLVLESGHIVRCGVHRYLHAGWSPHLAVNVEDSK